jgi:hypothetical protein
MSDVKRYDCTSGGAQFCQGCYTMTEDTLGDYVKFEDFDALLKERNELRSRLAAAELNQWQPISTAPKMRKIIVHYLNGLGKHRTVMACYYVENSLEMHDDYDYVGTADEYTGFADAGWYEEHDSEAPLMPLDVEPDFWMPLPAPPIDAHLTGDAPTGAGGNPRAFVCCEGVGRHADGCSAAGAGEVP